MGFSNTIRALANAIRMRADRLMGFFSAIRGRTDTISARADRLMGFYNAIRRFTIIAIAFVRLSLQMIQRSIRSLTE